MTIQRKPRPSEAAKAFLEIKLSDLNDPVGLDAEGKIPFYVSDVTTHLTNEHSCRDLMPYLLQREIQFIGREMEADLAKKGHFSKAEDIRLLRNTPQPFEENIHNLSISDDKKLVLLGKYAGFSESVEKARLLPDFFGVLEKIAAGEETLPLRYKDVLKAGYERLYRVADDLLTEKELYEREKTKPFNERLDNAIGIMGSCGHTINKNDFTTPHAEESLALLASRPACEATAMAGQVHEIACAARYTIRDIAKDIKLY